MVYKKKEGATREDVTRYHVSSYKSLGQIYHDNNYRNKPELTLKLMCYNLYS